MRCKHYEDFSNVSANCHVQKLLSSKSAVESYKAHCSVSIKLWYVITACT